MGIKEEFDKGDIMGTETTAEVLKIVENLKLKGYIFLADRQGNKQNFFIWRKGKKSEYIRVTLMSEGWHENKVYWWNLETSFKPFAYKHNHRENANITSDRFKGNETDKYFSYFLNIVDRIKRLL